MEVARNVLFSDAQLKGYYKLSDIEDATANNYDLTNVNTVTFTAGKYANCADFGTNNTNKCLHRTAAFGVANNTVSIGCWIKLRTEIPNNEQYMFVSHRFADNDTQVFIRGDDVSGTKTLKFCRDREGVSTTASSYTVTLGTTNWYFIVLTYDGTNIRGYVNGDLVAGPTAASGTGSGISSDRFTLGASYGLDDHWCSTYIDDAFIFNKVLSATEIANLYKEARGGGFLMNMI